MWFIFASSGGTQVLRVVSTPEINTAAIGRTYDRRPGVAKMPVAALSCRSTECYAFRMTQLVTRVDDELVRQVDRLVESGAVSSRSDAVRRGLRAVVDTERRRSVAESIIDGYRRLPQTEDEAGWTEDMARSMIAEEPW